MLGSPSNSHDPKLQVNKAARAAKDHRPLYIQIAEALRARIISGFYADRIDGELVLAREWKVSRRTMQQALDLLVGEGLINRQHGMGTFINAQNAEKRYRAITSITESITQQGLEVEFRILESGRRIADEDERRFYGLAAGEDVYRHERLILTQGKPLAVVSTSLNPQLLEGLELSGLNQSLYQTLRRDFGRTIVSAEDRYLPAIADERIRSLLDIPEQGLVFQAIRHAFDQTGAPIELSSVVMLPVPLEILIRRVGFAAPKTGEWDYEVGFGTFRPAC